MPTAPAPTSSPPWQGAAAVRRAGSSAIRDLLELTERPEILSLAGGLPNPARFPVEAIARATEAALASGPGALQYGATEGYRPLREWVADRHGTEVDRVIVTSGSQQALDLLARAIVEPGQVTALADPAYPGALQALRGAGAELAGIPVDAEGMCVDVLADRLATGLRPALVYVVANFDNPSGSTLPLERRLALAELADRYGFWLVEDDPYGDLRWGGPALPGLATRAERVVTLGSTSKVLSPGLRVGWAVTRPELRRAMTTLKQGADLHTGSLSQAIVHRVLVEPGFLDDHLDRLRASYRTQASALGTALRSTFGDRVAFADPDGGMFLWARFTGDLADVDTGRLLATALDHGVAFVPGEAFAVDATAGAHRSCLRMAYSSATPAELAEAVRRLDQTTRSVTSMLPRVAFE